MEEGRGCGGRGMRGVGFLEKFKVNLDLKMELGDEGTENRGWGSFSPC
jgi:hypothetical protein